MLSNQIDNSRVRWFNILIRISIPQLTRVCRVILPLLKIKKVKVIHRRQWSKMRLTNCDTCISLSHISMFCACYVYMFPLKEGLFQKHRGIVIALSLPSLSVSGSVLNYNLPFHVILCVHRMVGDICFSHLSLLYVLLQVSIK